MTAAADAFSGFLRTLEDTLDDHEMDGAARAGRLHLSRYHHDRLVASIAGESPGRLRRRVLLERAAFRLLTTRQAVVDVAVEAGYGSREAFSRAFTKAYGVPPRAWRKAPAGIAIPGPSDVHFHPPAGLRLPTRTTVTPMDLLSRLVEHHIWLTGRLIDRAALLDAAGLDAPIVLSVEGLDDDPTVRSVLSRLVGQMAQWNAAMDARGYDWVCERGRSLTALRRELDEEGSVFLDRVRSVMTEGRLDETFVDLTCAGDPQVFSYGGMVAHVLTFAAARRTLVCGALASAGMTDLGAGDPIRWVAEPGE